MEYMHQLFRSLHTVVLDFGGTWMLLPCTTKAKRDSHKINTTPISIESRYLSKWLLKILKIDIAADGHDRCAALWSFFSLGQTSYICQSNSEMLCYI